MYRDDMGRRMKEYYEQIPKTRLMRRVPVAIRIDGKTFHSFTRGFAKPFDSIMVEAMQNTMLDLCNNIPGCVLGYTQSDEITLILTDYADFDSGAWFDYEVQKLCSISGSMATLYFNRSMRNLVNEKLVMAEKRIGDSAAVSSIETYIKALEKGALFDSRCFNIPKEEVTNLIYWRQCDATRNSIQMVAQANFKQKEIEGKSCNSLQDMLLTQRDINWNDYPVTLKRGTACKKVPVEVDSVDRKTGNKLRVTRFKWKLDMNIPIFKDEGRKYIEELL